MPAEASHTLLTFYHAIILGRCLHLVLDITQYIGYIALKGQKPETEQTTPRLDVTVISATLGEEEGYIYTLKSWLRCDPTVVNIVTVEKAATCIKRLMEEVDDPRVQLFVVEKPSIRRQLSVGIQNTFTPLVVLVDDDSRWGRETLSSLTAAFDDSSVGGVNTKQYVRPRSTDLTMWESFGALNLVRRNIMHSAVAYFHDGQVLNLSGRTVAYRTSIIKNDEFLGAFLNDKWSGKYLIRTGDDSFITSWIVNHGWNTAFVVRPGSAIITTVNDDAKYMKQVLRWRRDTARHWLRDVGVAFKVNHRRLYVRCLLNGISNYATDFSVLTELAFLGGTCIYRATGIELSGPSVFRLFIEHVAVWSGFTLFEHLPFFLTLRHLKFIPGAIFYMYIHALTLGFAWLTLKKTVWGSRVGAD